MHCIAAAPVFPRSSVGRDRHLVLMIEVLLARWRLGGKRERDADTSAKPCTTIHIVVQGTLDERRVGAG